MTNRALILIDKFSPHFPEITRQHVAEIIALQALCLAQVRGIELDNARLSVIAAEVIAGQSPEQVQRYEAMSWEEAIGDITKELCVYIHQRSPQTVCLPDPHRVLQ